jgi:hypothetical protein
VRGINLEIYRLSVDTLVAASDSGCLVLDLTLDLAKICESPSLNMMKLCPLGSPSLLRISVGGGYGIWLGLVLFYVDQLQNERAASYDSAASRQKVTTNDVFEHGGFASGLRANDDLTRLCKLSETLREEESGEGA